MLQNADVLRSKSQTSNTFTNNTHVNASANKDNRDLPSVLDEAESLAGADREAQSLYKKRDKSREVQLAIEQSQSS